MTQTNEWAAEIRPVGSLRGKHGNYTVLLRAQDLGTPSHLTEAEVHICVTDYNDHAPFFISPPHNSTLRVPEVLNNIFNTVNQNFVYFLKFLFLSDILHICCIGR